MRGARSVSIRPIDIQISIQRTNEYTKEASLQNQKFNIDQFANSRDFQQVVEDAQRQVIPAGHIYHKRIDKEHDGRHRHPKYAKFHQDKGKECRKAVLGKEAEIIERNTGGNIDIRI